jgi:hypothetical protein
MNPRGCDVSVRALFRRGRGLVRVRRAGAREWKRRRRPPPCRAPHRGIVVTPRALDEMTETTPPLFDDGDGRWVAAWGCVAGIIAALMARIPLAGVAHVSDEVAYTMQARLFAAGIRVGPAGDNPSMLMYPFWSAEPVSFSPFPPGWPALLAVGEAVGAPWLVNPVLFAVFPALIWVLARTWTGRATARLSVVVAAVSPGLWVMAGTRMAHTSVLVALGVVAAVAVRRPARLGLWVIGGLAAGYVVIARPFDAALVAAPLLFIALRGSRTWPQRIAVVLLPGGAAIALLMDNAALTGELFRFPMEVWFDQWQPERPGCNRLGFGADAGCAMTLGTFGHSPYKAARLALEGLLRMDGLVLGLPGGLLLAGWGASRLRPRWPLWLCVVLLIGYGLYWSPGRAYGARFYHPMYLVLPIVLAVPLARLRWGMWLVVVVSVIGGSRVARELSDRYWCVDDGLAELLQERGIEDGVVFLRGVGERAMSWPVTGTPAFTCDPLLESGDGFQLNDPSTPSTGLRIRHALPSLAQTTAYMVAHHPGAHAWLIVHDVALDRYELKDLGVLAPATGG